MCKKVLKLIVFYCLSYSLKKKKNTLIPYLSKHESDSLYFLNVPYLVLSTSQEGFEPPTDALAYHHSFRYQCTLFVVWTISSPLQVRHV